MRRRFRMNRSAFDTTRLQPTFNATPELEDTAAEWSAVDDRPLPETTLGSTRSLEPLQAALATGYLLQMVQPSPHRAAHSCNVSPPAAMSIAEWVLEPKWHNILMCPPIHLIRTTALLPQQASMFISTSSAFYTNHYIPTAGDIPTAHPL